MGILQPSSTKAVGPSAAGRFSYWLVPFVVLGSGLLMTDHTFLDFIREARLFKLVDLSSLFTSSLFTISLEAFAKSLLFYGPVSLVLIFFHNMGWRRSWHLALAVMAASLVSGFITWPLIDIPEEWVQYRGMIHNAVVPPYDESALRFRYSLVPSILEGLGITLPLLFFIGRHQLNWLAILLTPLTCFLFFLPFVFGAFIGMSGRGINLFPFGFHFSGSGPFAFALFFYMGRSRWPFMRPREVAPFRTRGLFVLGTFLLAFTGLTAVVAWTFLW